MNAVLEEEVDEEKLIIEKLNNSLYTVEYLEEWINRKDTLDENAICALNCCCAKGYYQAIKDISKLNEPIISFEDIDFSKYSKEIKDIQDIVEALKKDKPLMKSLEKYQAKK